MQNKGKIFIIYHTPKESIFSDIYQPICVGNDKDEFDDFFLRDDVGENIADQNRKYNELTAIYWIYKHINEFKDLHLIGFDHYRRFLCFNGTDKTAYVRKYIAHDLIDVDNNSLEKIFNEEKYGLIAPRASHYKSVRKHYERSHNKKDLVLLLKAIENVAPIFLEDAKEYLDSKNEYLYNMFVFKRHDFLEYGKFLFDVVDEFIKLNDNISRLYVSERITGIYIYHLMKKGYKPLFLPVMHIRRKLVVPAFKQVVDNFKKGDDRGLFFKLKPLILCFMPRHMEEFFRRRKAR